jgi:two-component system, chemotaxis family, protein-glutamate methylesterase/glutaminase
MAKNLRIKPCHALVIGGSAGSLQVLLQVLPEINPAISFAVIIVVHRKAGPDHLLTDLLASKTSLPVKEAEEKEPILPAHIYIAPPDYHLLIENSRTFSLDQSEKINFSRPSIDVTFDSASHVYGRHLACLLLSGSNADGVEGLLSVNKNGGDTLVQDPETAAVSYMPAHAIRNVASAQVLRIEEMAGVINDL